MTNQAAVDLAPRLLRARQAAIKEASAAKVAARRTAAMADSSPCCHFLVRTTTTSATETTAPTTAMPTSASEPVYPLWNLTGEGSNELLSLGTATRCAQRLVQGRLVVTHFPSSGWLPETPRSRRQWRRTRTVQSSRGSTSCRNPGQTACAQSLYRNSPPARCSSPSAVSTASTSLMARKSSS